jgi:hypothetical protein
MTEDDLASALEHELAVLGEDELDFYSAEQRAVLLWRLRQFTSLGFDYANATVLAGAAVDLGQARKLVQAGCPVETAAQILL